MAESGRERGQERRNGRSDDLLSKSGALVDQMRRAQVAEIDAATGYVGIVDSISSDSTSVRVRRPEDSSGTGRWMPRAAGAPPSVGEWIPVHVATGRGERGQIETHHLAMPSVGGKSIRGHIIAGLDIRDDGSVLRAGRYTWDSEQAVGRVSTEHLVSSSVTGSKIAANVITASHIVADSITGSELAPGAVGNGHIVGSAVTGSKIAANVITASHIVANAITGSELAPGAVGNGHIVSGAVTASKIASGSVGNAQLATGAVDTSKIAAGSVTGSKLDGASVNTGHIVSGAVGTSQIAGSAITPNKLDRSYLSSSGGTVSGTLTVTGTLSHTGGNAGFFGVAATTRRASAAAASDLATVITLANDLRSGLKNLGLFS